MAEVSLARRVAKMLANPWLLPRSVAEMRHHGKNLEAHLHGLQREFSELKLQFTELQEHAYVRSSLVYKAFQVSGLWGDYIEFGVFRGGSMRQAYRAAKSICDSMADGSWDFSMSDKDAQKAAILDSFKRMRFIGFDSFSGIPASDGVDKVIEVFPEGTYAASRHEAESNILKDIPRDQLVLVEGFFDQTCTPETAERLNPLPFAIIHIDSDLYSSAVTGLNFCTPYLRNGTVIIFDEYLQFHGSPHLGEQRAFAEWCRRHPEWHVQELARESAGRVAFVLNAAADPVSTGGAVLD